MPIHGDGTHIILCMSRIKSEQGNDKLVTDELKYKIRNKSKATLSSNKARHLARLSGSSVR
jgi:hypothetical protein